MDRRAEIEGIFCCSLQDYGIAWFYVYETVTQRLDVRIYNTHTERGNGDVCEWVGRMKRNRCSMLSEVYNWIFCLFCSRTFLSIIGGVVAGILGFTGLKGFVFYLLLMAFTSLGLVAKAKFSIHTYFDSWNRVLVDGFLGGLMVGCLCSRHLSFVMICVWETLLLIVKLEEINLDKIGRHTYTNIDLDIILKENKI